MRNKFYTLVLIALVIAGGSLVSCTPDADVEPFEEIFNETDKNVLLDERRDPTDPPDSTYDPFKN